MQYVCSLCGRKSPDLPFEDDAAQAALNANFIVNDGTKIAVCGFHGFAGLEVLCDDSRRSDRALKNEGSSIRAPRTCSATAEIAKTRDENLVERPSYGRTAPSSVVDNSCQCRGCQAGVNCCKGKSQAVTRTTLKMPTRGGKSHEIRLAVCAACAGTATAQEQGAQGAPAATDGHGVPPAPVPWYARCPRYRPSRPALGLGWAKVARQMPLGHK